MNENINSVSVAEIENFCEGLQHMLSMGRQVPLESIEVTAGIGARFIRIVVKDGPGCYAYAFVDRSNGNILKPAGWKGPAKHARGNIRDGGPENGWAGACGLYGVKYLN